MGERKYGVSIRVPAAKGMTLRLKYKASLIFTLPTTFTAAVAQLHHWLQLYGYQRSHLHSERVNK